MPKSWDDLSPAYRSRLSKHGITRETHGKIRADVARGHGKTPEHPERVARNPDRYRDYIGKRQDLMRQVIARKERLFGDRVKFRAKDSAKNVLEGKESVGNMRKFLKMDPTEIEDLDYKDDEWQFLFYH